MIELTRIRKKLSLEYSLVKNAIAENNEKYIMNDIPFLITPMHKFIVKCKRIFSIVQCFPFFYSAVILKSIIYSILGVMFILLTTLLNLVIWDLIRKT